MNYKNVYDRFIAGRQSSPVPSCYTEKHHILPRSLGGLNGKSNLIRLTPSDHLFAHKLLAKIYNTRGLWFALVTMCSEGGLSARGIKASRHDYERARMKYSESFKLNHPSRGKALTDEHRRKLSENSARLSEPNHPMFGKRHTEESILKMKNSSPHTNGKNHPMAGRKHTDLTKEKMRDARAKNQLSGEKHHMFGKKLSEETRIKMKISQLKRRSGE